MLYKLAITVLLLGLLFISPSLAGGKGGKPAAPKNYSFEDLKSVAQSYRSYFSFYNYYQPKEAMAALPSQPPDCGSPAAVAAKFARFRVFFGGYHYLSFPWDDPNIKEGDVVFIRGGDAVSWVIRFFSTWTHTAMVYDKSRGETFESQKDHGVNTYRYVTAWRNIVAYSAKRVKIADPARAMRAAYNSFAGKVDYFPTVAQSAMDLRGFFQKWSDKWDTSSMYCAKLVWWTFKNYVDLDSNRTTSFLAGMWQSTYSDTGMFNWNAWIGVSPDDIYYSKNIGKDIVIDGQYNLGYPLADSIF